MSKQVDTELAIARLAVALEAYDSANPDVGMPPGMAYFIQRAAERLGLEPDDYDITKVTTIIGSE